MTIDMLDAEGFTNFKRNRFYVRRVIDQQGVTRFRGRRRDYAKRLRKTISPASKTSQQKGVSLPFSLDLTRNSSFCSDHSTPQGLLSSGHGRDAIVSSAPLFDDRVLLEKTTDHHMNQSIDINTTCGDD
jgi:hypothetical protein